MTSHSTSRPRRRAASTVRAVWFTAPRPGRATISRRTPRARGTSAIVRRRIEGTSSPPDPWTLITSMSWASLRRSVAHSHLFHFGGGHR
jgi:hypothetical protein